MDLEKLTLSLLEDVEGSQVGLVVQQDVFVGAVGGVDSNHLLVDGVDVVQPPVHDRDTSRLRHGVVLLAADDDPSIRAVQVAGLDLGLARRREVEDLLLDVDRQELGTFQVALDDHFHFSSVHVGLAYLCRDSVAAAIEPEEFSGVGVKREGDGLSHAGLVSASGVDDQHPVLELAFDPNQADLSRVDVADVQVPADPVEGDAVGIADDAGVGFGEEQTLLAAAKVGPTKNIKSKSW